MHNVRAKWVRLTAPHLKVPPQLNRARCTPQQAQAGLAESAARCEEMLAEASTAVGAASRSFAGTDGLRLGRLARKCCATCLLTKPTIAGRCACSRISSDSHCRTRLSTGSGIGKSCGESAGHLAAPATILKESSRTQATHGWDKRSRQVKITHAPGRRYGKCLGSLRISHGLSSSVLRQPQTFLSCVTVPL
jgi:hypothetical protein